MEKITDIMPLLALLPYKERIDAVVRMCCAHVLNGGEYVGIYETALAYLHSVGYGKDEQ